MLNLNQIPDTEGGYVLEKIPETQNISSILWVKKSALRLHEQSKSAVMKSR